MASSYDLLVLSGPPPDADEDNDGGEEEGEVMF
jgi:hypothetical protein